MTGTGQINPTLYMEIQTNNTSRNVNFLFEIIFEQSDQAYQFYFILVSFILFHFLFFSFLFFLLFYLIFF